MGRKRLRIADLAQEAGITESEAIKRLRHNGMEARQGYRISASELPRAREILFSGTEAINARGRQDSNLEAADESEAEAQLEEERMTIHDVVEAWVSENPEPRHITVEGKRYRDFIDSCYQYLLAHAMKHGAPSTDVFVGDKDRQQIVDFLNRAKTRWDMRRHEEQVKAEERRQAESRRQVEEQRRAERIHRSEVLIRIAKMRAAEERRRADKLNQAIEQRRAADSARQDEIFRRERILAKHQQSVENKHAFLLDGQCTDTDYYAYVLRDRINRSAEVLFGSVEQPNYEILKKNPKLLEELKELSFGDDRHPSNYQNPYVSAYYTLRYEAGYAFEYSQVYGLLLAIMHQQNETSPFDVISIGSGQGLDYWGLRYALSKQGLDWFKIGWRGIDSEKWPDHILDDGVADYSDGVDVREVLRGMSSLNAKVLMFPKVISELSSEVISFIVSWLEHVTFTRDVHYLCFIHTERNSLNPLDDKHRVDGECFHYPTDFALDAVKSAALISAARNGAARQFYSSEFEWCDSSSMTVSHYDVAWPDGQAGKEWRDTYSYLDYGEKDVSVWEYDHTFEMSKTLRDAVKGIGYSCCTEYISSGTDKGCDTQRVSCNDSYRCPLHRYPRFRTPRIAYQIVRLVKQPDYDEDIPF